jgi:alpha-mannosidase
MAARKHSRGKPEVVVAMWNHFDNIWRRCWDRPYEHKGKQYSSYVKIEKRVLDEQYRLAMSSRCYAFEVESSRILRRWLADRPDRDKVAANLKKLLREGRFLLLGAGEVIPDANMPVGETLARNLAEGIWWAEETLGERPKVGWHADGFGSPAQLPQIFREVEIGWIAALSYCTPSRNYWRGLDGTITYIGQFGGGRVSSYIKYPPCPECHGKGCRSCDKSGFDASFRLAAGELPQMPKSGKVWLVFTGEEVLPPVNLEEAFRRWKAKADVHAGTHMSFYKDIAHLLTPENLTKPPKGEISPERDGNPSSSGCLVSRIELKRRHRFSEYALFAAQALDAAVALDREPSHLGREPQPYIPSDPPAVQDIAGPRVAQWDWYPAGAARAVPEMNVLWRDLSFGAFHDAITATHNDPAYDELMDLYSYLEDSAAAHIFGSLGDKRGSNDKLRVFLPQKVTGPVEMWPLSKLPENVELTTANGEKLTVVDDYRTLEGSRRLLVEGLRSNNATFVDVQVKATKRRTVKEQPSRPVVKCGAFTVRLDKEGIVQIDAGGKAALRRRKDYPIGLFLEADHGDPWATRSLDRPRRPVEIKADEIRIVKDKTYTEITVPGTGKLEPLYATADPWVIQMKFVQHWRLYEKHPFIDLKTEITWSAYDRRVRLCFPTTMKANKMWTEVPFGVIERDRYEMKVTQWNNANGDWPCIGWAAIEEKDGGKDRGKGRGFAVMNRGTPSVRTEDGVMLVSVLRSPTFPNCLEEPTSYSAPQYDGMRDPGRHVFNHRLVFYAGSWREAGLVDMAREFNQIVPAVPAGDAPEIRWPIGELPTGVTLAAMKRPHQGRGLVLRLSEMHGEKREFGLEVRRSELRTAWRMNFLEDKLAQLPMKSCRVSIKLRPFEIATFGLE